MTTSSLSQSRGRNKRAPSCATLLLVELPEIHHLALTALAIKFIYAVLAIVSLTAKLLGRVEAASDKVILTSLAGLGSKALICAAILRWFS
jgi:hypothetical protein